MMSDMRADDEDRLPWLEAVDEEDVAEGPSVGKLAAFVIIGLAAIGLIVGGLFWMNGSDDAGTGADQTLIAAPAGDYKVKPDDPGGMKVEGQGDTVFAASEGMTTNGSVDVTAIPENPVAGKAAPKPTPTPVEGASRVVASVPKAVEQVTVPVRQSAGASAGSAVEA